MDEDNLEVFNTVRGLLVNLRNKHDLHRAAANPALYQKGIRTYNPAWIDWRYSATAAPGPQYQEL